jgi:hypothetical protein
VFLLFWYSCTCRVTTESAAVYAFWSIETIQFKLGSAIPRQATLPIDETNSSRGSLSHWNEWIRRCTCIVAICSEPNCLLSYTYIPMSLAVIATSIIHLNSTQFATLQKNNLFRNNMHCVYLILYRFKIANENQFVGCHPVIYLIFCVGALARLRLEGFVFFFL